jgi:TRAP-type C4-dicarboxylate transport system substrate-binding protein
MIKRRDVLTSGLAFVGALAAPSIVFGQAKKTMRISHPLPVAHHTAKSIQAFADAVKELSKGEIEVQIFPSEQAAKANENHPQVARGGVEAAASVNFQWGATIPEMSVTVIPFLLTDLARLKKFSNSEVTKILDAKLQQRGVTNLMWLYTTRQTIFTANKPIRALEDLKGVKMRGLNRLADTWLVAEGAAPSAMAAPEVYQALQSGVLDAAQTDVSAAVSRRFYEVQKHGTVTPLFSVFYHLYMNPAWWTGLTPQQQGWLKEAAAKAEAGNYDLTEATAAAAVGTLREKGMTIHEMTPTEIAVWQGRIQKPVMDEFVKQAGAEGQKLLDALAKL